MDLQLEAVLDPIPDSIFNGAPPSHPYSINAEDNKTSTIAPISVVLDAAGNLMSCTPEGYVEVMSKKKQLDVFGAVSLQPCTPKENVEVTKKRKLDCTKDRSGKRPNIEADDAWKSIFWNPDSNT